MAERDTVAAGIAVVALTLAVRALRLGLVLDPDSALVRNPYRSYRLRYGDMGRVGEEPLVLLGNEYHSWRSTPRA